MRQCKSPPRITYITSFLPRENELQSKETNQQIRQYLLSELSKQWNLLDISLQSVQTISEFQNEVIELVKARSQDPILRIRFLVPEIGSRCSDGPISRFRFCGGNVGRSFVVCSHDPIFRTDKESSVWRQNNQRDIMQNLSAPFVFQEECRMKIEHVLFPSVSSNLRIHVLEGHFQCVHTIRFSEPTKIGSLKTDRVNGPLHEVKSNKYFTTTIRTLRSNQLQLQQHNYISLFIYRIGEPYRGILQATFHSAIFENPVRRMHEDQMIPTEKHVML